MTQTVGGIVGQDAPQPFFSLLDLFAHRVASAPDAIVYAFVRDNLEIAQALTGAELAARVQRLAASLRSEVPAGSRVLLVYPPGTEVVVAFWACLHAGLVAVPAPSTDAARLKNSLPRLLGIIQDSDAALVLTSGSVIESGGEAIIAASGARARWRVTDDDVAPPPSASASATPSATPSASFSSSPVAPPTADPGTLAYLQYTSGSTSTPRGVMITHGNVLANCASTSAMFGPDAASRSFSWLPYFHDYGLVHGILWPFFAGIPAYLMSPTAFLRRPLRWLEAIEKFSITHSGAPNFGFQACVEALAGKPDWRGNLQTLRVASCGAEPINPGTIERFTQAFAPHGWSARAFAPGYGLAEATLLATMKPVGQLPRVLALDPEAITALLARVVAADAPGARTYVGCGVAIAGTSVRIVDPQTLAPVAAGGIGEIWLAGEQIGAGYWNNPSASEAVFGQSLAGEPGERFLRTGDLGVLLEGELFITGRLKDLLIFRGRNHYPQDIEWVAERADPNLRAGYCAALSVDGEHGEELVIVQEVERRVSEDDLQVAAQAIRRAVAQAFELPVRSVVLIRSGSIARTSSGKIRRQQCRQELLDGTLQSLLVDRLEDGYDTFDADTTFAERIAAAESAAQRRTLIEQFLQQALAQAARRPFASVPWAATPIEAGLDSLAAFRLLQTIEAVLGVELPASAVLGTSSLGRLCAALDDALANDPSLPARAAQDGSDARLDPASVEGPLSLQQQGMWLAQELAGASALYNLALASRLRGPLDTRALRGALQQLVERHDSLRTTFQARDGEPVAVLVPEATITLDETDLSGREPAERECSLALALEAMATQTIDLTRAPLVRAVLIRLGEQEHVLGLVVHHLAADGWSVSVLARELDQLYTRITENRPAQLPAPRARYAAFTGWQLARATTAAYRDHVEYWRAQLREMPPMDLPTDRVRGRHSRNVGDVQRFEIPAPLAQSLRVLAGQEKVTLFVLLLAAFKVLLMRTSGQEDITVGAPSAARPARRFDEVVGLFTNTLVMRTDLSGNPSFRELLERLRAVASEAFEHQDVPSDRLVAELGLRRDTGRNPLYQVAFALQNMPDTTLKLAGCANEPIALNTRTAKNDLWLSVFEHAGGLHAELEYDVDLFDADSVERLGRGLRTLLGAIVQDPSQPIGSLALLDEAQRSMILEQWNRTQRDYPLHKCYPQLFEEQVRRTPDAVAVRIGDEHLTYAALNRRTNLLAHRLRAQGVGPDVLVAVCMHRSLELLVAILAVLKAGGAYVPIDPDYPLERITGTLEDSATGLLLTEPAMRLALERVPLPDGLVMLDVEGALHEAAQSAGRTDDPERVNKPADGAYVIYTSGSTGRPKGVLIPHLGLANHFHWIGEKFSLGTSDRVLHRASIGFDVSVFELLSPLCWGAAVVMVAPGEQGDDDALIRTIRTNGVTLMQMVPSLLRVLVENPRVRECTSVRFIICGGEAMDGELARAVREALPGTGLGNYYGPSEASDDVTHHLVTPADETARSIPIGVPIANARCHVLDGAMAPVPAGVVGELYIGGAGLARGYLRRPELTAQRFVADPFREGERLYRTGDLARYRADGEIEYVGRVDHQVKIRGMRVELGEIESVLAAQPSVRQSAVLVREDRPGVRRLTGYVEGQALDAQALRQSLARQLPDYMVPAAIVVMPALPLLANGKLDRRSLPAPDDQTSSARPVMPRSPAEQAVFEIWREVLAFDAFGVHEDFFALGGHSLLAARVISRVRRVMGVELALRELFEAPTIALLARRIAQERDRALAQRPPIVRIPRVALMPVSAARRRMWFWQQLAPGIGLYNVPLVLDIDATLTPARIEQAIATLVARHEILRSRILERGDDLYEVIDAAPWAALRHVDLSAEPAHLSEEALASRCLQEGQAPFDLTRDTGLRATLLSLAPDRYRLLLTLHHSVCDGWSVEWLLDELRASIDARGSQQATQADTPALAEVDAPSSAPQFADYDAWLAAVLAGGVRERQIRYWREALAGVPPVLNLPTDRPPARWPSFQGASVGFVLDAQALQQVRAFAARQGLSLFMVLLAAWQLFLHRTSGQATLATGSVVANRAATELEPIVGFLANTIALRSDLAPGMGVAPFLAQVKERALGAYENALVPFEDVVEAFGAPRDAGRSPLVQTMMVLQPPSVASRSVQGGTITLHQVPQTLARLDLALTHVERDGELLGTLNYATDLFDEATVVKMGADYRALLLALASDTQATIDALVAPASAAPVFADDPSRFMLLPKVVRAPRTGPRTLPQGATELAVAQVWREVLKADELGADENFFELGGNSLMATQVVSRIRRRLNVELPLRDLFDAPTITGLARRINESAATTAPDQPLDARIDVLARDRLLPASYAQRRMWLVQQINPQGTAYNMPFVVRLRGKLDRGAMDASLTALVARHEAFRTTFEPVEGEPWQRIGLPYAVTADFHDFAGHASDQRLAAATEFIQQQTRLAFDLNTGPLFRALVVRIDEDDHVLLLLMHHAIGDQWSSAILFRDLRLYYDACCLGREANLPALEIQYADYAVWQRNDMDSGALDAQLAFWQNELSAVPVLTLPADRPAPAQLSGRGAHVLARLDPPLIESLRSFSAARSATPFMVTLACFVIVLARYSGQKDIVLGTPIANRTRLATENLVGTLVNTLVMRTKLDDDPDFLTLIARVRDKALDVFANQDVPFERLVEQFGGNRGSSHSPLVQVMFNMPNAPMEIEPPVGLAYDTLLFERGAAQFELSLTIDTEVIGAVLIEYSTDLYERASVERLLGHYVNTLRAALAQPEQPVSRLEILSAQERHTMLEGWNATLEDYPRDRRVSDLVREQAGRTPDAIAVAMDDEVLSYRELEKRSNQLAHHLRGLGAGAGATVGIALERSPELLVALLGAMKAGATYVPLDPAFPRDRLMFMAQDAGLAVVVTQSSLAQLLALERSRSVLLDADRAVLSRCSSEPFALAPDGDAIAYVLYTSGSTGKPKGVEVPHRALTNFLWTMKQAPGCSADDVLLAITTLSFDISGLELYLPLMVGARVEIASRLDTSDGRLLAQKITHCAPTMIQATPATWRMLLASGWKGSERMTLLCGGEGLPRDLADHLIEGGARLWNMYGPTETTIWSTVEPVTAQGREITIGRPIANTRVYVLDEAQQPVPPGVAGELYIGGDGLARGYRNRPDLTAERFVVDPFVAGGAARMYRTGDLARFLPDGRLVHMGRLDFQVKIRGFRIELGEIESVLGTHPGVAQVVVAAKGETSGASYLVAYLITRDGQPLAMDALRTFVRQSLPDYMVPSNFVFLERFPLTANNKVDVKALPDPGEAAPVRKVSDGSVRSPLEVQLSALWAQVLGFDEIADDDNFFDLGGHSLKAVQLLTSVEQVFGRKIPLATLFQTPTLGQMVALLKESEWVPSWRSLVAIQPAGDRVPLFAVPGVGGNVLGFAKLAKLLGPDQPFYGLQSRGLDGAAIPFVTIPEMAKEFVAEIRSVRPQGPYFIGGTCTGGVTAYEIAQQLRAQGEQVALVIMESWHPVSYRITANIGIRFWRIQFILSRIISYARVLRNTPWREWPGFLRSKVRRMAVTLDKGIEEAAGSQYFVERVVRATMQAVARYEAYPYDGALLNVVATDRPIGEGVDDSRRRWEELALESSEYAAVPAGDSGRLFVSPHVETLAALIRDYAQRKLGAASKPVPAEQRLEMQANASGSD